MDPLDLLPSMHSRLALALALPLAACTVACEPEAAAPATQSPAASAQPATLQREDSFGRVLQTAAIAQLGSTPVTLANGDALRVDVAADAAFVQHRALAQQVERAGGALLGAAETVEEFAETEHGVVLTARTHFVVTDPIGLRQAAPRVAALQMRPEAAPDLTELGAEQRAWFDAFKRRMLQKAPKHPLGAAARQGDAALWAAALSGQGDMTITTRVRVPTSGLTRAGDQVMAPVVRDGEFDYGDTEPVTTRSRDLPDDYLPYDDQLVVTTEAGERTTVSQFVNGFLEDDGAEVHEYWDFAIGYIDIRAGAWYALGLRAPIKVSTTMSPVDIRRFSGRADAESEFATELRVEPLDADEDFYTKAGVPAADLYDGEELVLSAGAYVHVRASLIGVINVDRTIPAQRGPDWGQNFVPPFGDCGTDCGFQVWVPASATRTQINILGIVRGEAQLGFLVAGDGQVDLAYESLDDGVVVRSRRGDGPGRDRHALSFTDGSSKGFRTKLAALEEPGSKRFGYRVSAVDYTWNVEVRPGVRGSIEVDGGLFHFDGAIGPVWIDFARFDLGTIHLGRLDGTRAEHLVESGRKRWDVLEPSDLTPGELASAEQTPYWEPTEEQQDSAFGGFCFTNGGCPVTRDGDASYTFHDGELQAAGGVGDPGIGDESDPHPRP